MVQCVLAEHETLTAACACSARTARPSRSPSTGYNYWSIRSEWNYSAAHTRVGRCCWNTDEAAVLFSHSFTSVGRGSNRVESEGEQGLDPSWEYRSAIGQRSQRFSSFSPSHFPRWARRLANDLCSPSSIYFFFLILALIQTRNIGSCLHLGSVLSYPSGEEPIESIFLKKGKIVKRSNLIQSELKFEGSNSPARLTNDFSFTFLFSILIPLPIFLPSRFYFLFNQTNLLFIFHTGSGTKDQRYVLYDSLGSSRHLFSSWTSKTKRENLHNFHLFLRNGCWLWRGDGAARHPEPKAPLQLPILIGCCTPANNGYIRLRAKNGFCIAISHCGQTSARWRREQE